MNNRKGENLIRLVTARLLVMFLAMAMVFTMMPVADYAFAADAADYQPALTITGPDGTVSEYKTVKDVLDKFTEGEDTESFGAALKGVYSKKLLSGYDDDCVVTVQTQDNYTGALNASSKTVKELKELKGILAYEEDGKAYDPTSDELNKKGNKLYEGYFVWFVGKDADGNVMKDKWVNRITISAAGGGSSNSEPEKTVDVLSISGDDLVKPLNYGSIKELKNDEDIKPLIKEAKFTTLNSSNTKEVFTVTGVTIEDLLTLAGFKEGKELDTVIATAEDGYSKTYTADQILNESLDGNKAMFIWDENGDKVQKIALGQFAEDEQNRKLWVSGKESITITVTAKDVPAPIVPSVKRPGKVTIKSVTSKKTSVTLKWKKVSGAKGYVVYRSTKKSSGFKAVKTFKKGSTVKFTNKKLKKNKTYYYKIRAYKLNSKGKKVFGKYSKVKKIRTKK